MADLAFVSLLCVLGATAVVALRSTYHPSSRVLELRFPGDFRDDQAAQVVRALGGHSASWWDRLVGAPPVVFEVRADNTGIRHLVRVPESFTDFLATQLSAAGVRFRDFPEQLVPVSTGAEFRRASLAVPVSSEAAISAGLLAAMQPLANGQRVVMQVTVRPAVSPAPAALEPATSWWQQSLGLAPAKATPAASDAQRHWQREPAFAFGLRLGISAPSARAERHLLGRLIDALALTRSYAPALRRRLMPGKLAARRINQGGMPPSSKSLARATELPVLLALPVGGQPVPGLSVAGARQLAPPQSVPRTGRVLGDATYPGAERPVAVSRPVGATRHMWAIAPSGAGKSTLLLNAALDDATSGAGLCIIDPSKGDLIHDFVDLLPANRAKDLILLDAADAAWPVGFNLLADTGASPELAADGVLHILRHLSRTRWGGSWGPRLEDVLRGSLITVARSGLSLAELPPLLLDPTMRRQVVKRIDDPLGVEPFWAWYEGLSDGEREQAIGPVLSRVRAFLATPQIRNIVGQRQSAFSMPDVLAQGKILCVSLPRGVIGQDASTLLGAGIVASLWRAVLGRSAVAPSARRPFYVYADEFQDLIALPTSFGEALAASRGMNVGWTIANQHAAQLPAELRAAALANARTKICFQLSAQDAALFAKEFRPSVSADDLAGLAPF